MIESFILNNGFKLSIRADCGLPQTCISIYLDGGVRFENITSNGISHFCEHLVVRGGTALQKEHEYRLNLLKYGKIKNKPLDGDKFSLIIIGLPET